MQKLHKSKTPKVYKNKKLNNANFGTYNLNDYQVFLQLISMIGGVDELGKYLQPQELQREHILTAKAFSEQFNVELDGAYTTLKRVAKKLTETSLTLEKPDLFVTQHIALCSQTEYNHKQGSLTVRFTEEIMPYLAQVKSKFVLYNLKEVANFGSLYSTRLYELIQEFKDTGYIMKSVTQLRDLFVVGKKFPLYGNFKAKTFGHAVEEINSQYELKLRFEEIKEGRKVVAIRFEFIPTFTSKGYNPATKEMVNTTVKPRRKQQGPPELPNLEPTLVAKRAREKEYRARHKAKKLEEATTNLNPIMSETQELLENQQFLEGFTDELVIPEPSLYIDEEELNGALAEEIDPELEKLVANLSKKELIELLQHKQQEEQAKNSTNTTPKPRKKLFGIF